MVVKVCGMKFPENIKAVLALNPDYLGFIFYPKSPRYIVDENPDLDIIPEQVGRIGVFVNEAIETIDQMVGKYKLTGVQLHGSEPAETCLYFKQKGLTVFKAFGLNETFDFSALKDYDGIVDLFVFDTKVKEHGGSGKKFDWHLLDNYTLDTPFLLSGGISAEDAEAVKAIQHSAMQGVDLNSRFEIEPALKDEALLAQFLTELRKN